MPSFPASIILYMPSCMIFPSANIWKASLTLPPRAENIVSPSCPARFTFAMVVAALSSTSIGTLTGLLSNCCLISLLIVSVLICTSSSTSSIAEIACLIWLSKSAVSTLNWIGKSTSPRDARISSSMDCLLTFNFISIGVSLAEMP